MQIAYYPNKTTFAGTLTPNFCTEKARSSYDITNPVTGNVHVVISDRKIAVDDDNDGTIDYYTADVLATYDYYGFGSEMPGRSFNSNAYRYGWNKGSEKDDEIAGISGAYITTFFREYDTRLGRTWTPDPVFQPWQSPYTSMDNNPIRYNDPLGDWVKGAGFFRNVFNSDAKINAQNKAAATGGSAFKDGNGWTVNYTTGETVNLGNGNVNLKTYNVEHYANKPGALANFSNWWKNSDLYFNASGKVDIGVQAGGKVQIDGAVVELEGSLFTVDLLGASVEQRENDSNPVEFDFDYVGKKGHMNVSQYAGAGFVGGINYTHSFEGGVNGGYKNEKHTTTINAVVVQYKNEQAQKSAHNLSFTISGRAALLLGIEGEVSFGVKDKNSFK